ncbi:hypothetical protein COU36_02510 [Candidatus Micrarchaeota archaeon CG10_big_fil_rev_8_21_14_0_10_59_7]|nr:MAG: hypothetical protein COU36_02510 [Candidatus Micrarchaeota archaeon CG10_big_fil_rev_8_21_14_0_10_59_7]
MEDDPEHLEEKAVSLKEERDSTNRQASVIAKQNTERIGLLKQTIAESNEARRVRDAENKAASEFREKRRAIEDEINGMRAKMDALQKEMHEMPSTPGGEDPDRLMRRIEDLEWIQQTEALSATKEKEMSKRIKELRKKMPNASRNMTVRAEMRGLREAIRNKSGEAKALREEMEKHARLADEQHAKRVALLKKARKMEEKLADVLKELGDVRDKADDAHEGFLEARGEARRITDAERAKEKAEKDAKDKEMRSKLGEQAKAILTKFKAGEKLSFEEIQVLQETGAL